MNVPAVAAARVASTGPPRITHAGGGHVATRVIGALVKITATRKCVALAARVWATFGNREQLTRGRVLARLRFSNSRASAHHATLR